MHSIFLPQTPRAVAAVYDRRITIQPAKPRIEPLPREQWPLFIRVIAKFHQPQDTGLGDTVVHLIGDERSVRFKKWFQEKFGKSCGCTRRQQWLNARFSYL